MIASYASWRQRRCFQADGHAARGVLSDHVDLRSEHMEVVVGSVAISSGARCCLHGSTRRDGATGEHAQVPAAARFSRRTLQDHTPAHAAIVAEHASPCVGAYGNSADPAVYCLQSSPAKTQKGDCAKLGIGSRAKSYHRRTQPRGRSGRQYPECPAKLARAFGNASPVGGAQISRSALCPCHDSALETYSSYAGGMRGCQPFGLALIFKCKSDGLGLSANEFRRERIADKLRYRLLPEVNRELVPCWKGLQQGCLPH